jgi:hypothetical protein
MSLNNTFLKYLVRKLRKLRKLRKHGINKV